MVQLSRYYKQEQIDQIQMCQQMCELLPLKMQQIRQTNVSEPI